MLYTVLVRMTMIMNFTRKKHGVVTFIVTCAFLTLAIIIPRIPLRQAQAEALRSTRLDAKLVDASSRVIDNSLIESTFRAKVRAYGGDIYLPAYTEDMVFVPVFMPGEERINAIIPGSATVRVKSDLTSTNGRYVLKEYESADIDIVVTSKVIPSGMPSDHLVFRIRLASLIWKPVIQQFNEDAVGNPLLDISQLNWETNPVIVWKTMPSLPAGQGESARGILSALKGSKRDHSDVANVFGIFSRLQSMFR